MTLVRSLDRISSAAKAASVSVGVLALSTAAALAQAAAETPAAAAPNINKGDTTWMLVSTILVVMMTVPGLALFYGGLVRAKNILSVLMQVFVGFSLISILWVVYGYSLAFTGAGTPGDATALTPFIGTLDKMMLKGVGIDAAAETFTKGVYIPELTFVIFQLTFAAITPALIIGAIAERMKFSSVLAFLVLWFTFSYLPIAHMVWWWGGPSAPADSPSGFLYGMGALDFAGGTVVHINAGIAGLVCCLVLGKRIGYGKDNMAPHNLTLTLIGGCLLWVGWFGFNAGSNLEANGLTAQALLNTIVATAAAALAWMFVEWMTKGHPSLLGAVSGAVAGLVAITPAAGLAGAGGAIVLGAVAGVVCLWAVVSLKAMLGYDDSLDVFGVHGVGGIVGALGTAVVAAPSLGGFGVGEYTIAGQFVTQVKAVAVSVVWSGVVSLVALMVVKVLFGLRVSEQAEREGLDIATHGERAYN
ncbi:ammonium transporter [Prosthecomicrobium sp. N25]|uniref:ammonium transporter n=1 Tax=Prosthecomicrobium sp. N25 TaxID=3129254 RepID=UPI0030768C01